VSARALLVLAAAAALAPAPRAAALPAGEELPADLKAQLADPDPRTRSLGLKALRGRMDEAAAKAVVPFLDDRDPYCRDFACWNLLARTKDEAALKFIAQRAPRVSSSAGRLAAADALAEIRGPVAAGALAFLVGDRDARVRETAVDGLARCGPVDDLQAGPRVRAALADGSPGVRAAALAALARWRAPDAAEAAERALADADGGVRAHAAEVLAELAPARFGERFPALAADADWAVRVAAARRVRALDAAPPVEVLAALLEDPRMRVGDVAHDALRALSGLDLPPVRKDWTDWWGAAKAKWRGGSKGTPREATRPSAAEYHGLPFRSDAVLFVADLSGSMDQPLGAVDRRPRIVVAGEELARTLNALPDGARADVMAFMLEPLRAVGRIGELKGGTRDRLRKWFERQPRGRKGDLGAALAAAVLDGEADTVLFLGDGAASAGDCLFQERIRERVRQALRLRPVAIHAVAYGSRPPDRQFLEELAGMTGGRCIER
jgi:HEAT repeat protein